MIRRTTTIHNHLGLHARAAARFVALASAYACEIHVCHGDKRVNGKSIMGLMMLAAGDGAELVLEAEGTDAEAAVAALAELVSNGFSEEDSC